MANINSFSGTVKWYNRSKGFGIITNKSDDQEVFVHHSDIHENKQRNIVLVENEEVVFNVENKNNKICATNVKPSTGTFKNIIKNKNHKQKHKRVKNTTDFTPSHDAVDMRIVVHEPSEKYTKNITVRDVVLVNNLFKPEEDIYNKLKLEIEQSGLSPEQLWKSWHGDTHYIADDKLEWKKQCPTFDYVLKRIESFFDMQIKATRLNHYNDSKEWKPFHHDAAAVKKDKADTQNFTVAVSFGLERDVAFQHAKNGTVLSSSVGDGCLYAFSRDVNIIWKHGVRQMKEEEYKNEGRFSIIAWGWKDMAEI